MASFFTFWLPAAAVLFSWEAVLINPGRISLWFGLCLVAAGVIAWQLATSLVDRLSILLLLAGVFWWGLWLDFSLAKFALPVVIAVLLVYVGLFSRVQEGSARPYAWLAVFLGGTFFWSSIAFGMVTVLGRSLWESLLVFLAAFCIFARSATIRSRSGAELPVLFYFLLILLAAEIFSVLVWLPFTEITLGLLATVALLFFYDMAKYMAHATLIRRRIIVKKIILYVVFIILVLFSTPWQ